MRGMGGGKRRLFLFFFSYLGLNALKFSNILYNLAYLLATEIWSLFLSDYFITKAFFHISNYKFLWPIKGNKYKNVIKHVVL